MLKIFRQAAFYPKKAPVLTATGRCDTINLFANTMQKAIFNAALPQNGVNMKTGLVLEGGAMRGLYTAGVLDVLMENGVTVDGTIGVSAGALFGCNYKSRQIGRTIRYNKKYCRDPRYVSVRSLLRTGDLYNVEFCYHELPQTLDVFDTQAFAQNPMEFWVNATDVTTGEAVYHCCTNGGEHDIQWMRASGSMPLAARVVELDGRKLLDGGIVDSIPLAWMEQHGFDRIAVILTQPAGYRKTKSSILPLFKLLLRKYPAVAQAMARRHEVYNRTLDEVEQKSRDGQIFMLRPSRATDIKRTDRRPEKLQEQYDLGRADALAQLDALREFLKK